MRPGPALWIFALALAVRLAFLAELAPSPLADLSELPASDMYWYDRWARDIARGDWLGRDLALLYTPWQDRVGTRQEWGRWFEPGVYNPPPLYLYFVAVPYAVLGPSAMAVFLAQALLGAGGCALLYAIGRRAFGAASGIAAGVAGAVYGPLVFYDGVLLRTTLIAVLSLLACYTLMRAHATGRLRHHAEAGASAGLAVLAQPTALLFAGPAFLWAVLVSRPRRRAALAAAGLALGFVLPLGALAARNLAVGVPPFAVASRGPFAMVVGNVAGAPLGGQGFVIPDAAVRILRESDYALGSAIVATLRTHDSPVSFLALQGRKLLAAFSDFEIYNNVSYDYFAAKLSVLGALPHFAHVAGLGLVGLALSLSLGRAPPEWRGPRSLLSLYLLYGLATAIASLVLSRYRIPLATALIVYAGFAIAWIARELAARRIARGLAAAAAAAALGVAVAWNPVVRLPRARTVDPIGIAQILARDGRPARAAHELETSLPRFRGRPADQAQLLRQAARYRRGAGQRARAEELLRRAALLEAAQLGKRAAPERPSR